MPKIILGSEIEAIVKKLKSDGSIDDPEEIMNWLIEDGVDALEELLEWREHYAGSLLDPTGSLLNPNGYRVFEPDPSGT